MKLSIQRLLTPALALFVSGLASAQTTWIVDDDGPGDPFPGVSIPGNPAFSDPAEDGSALHPFDDIYKAVNAAANGDLVLVRPSNYIGFYAFTGSLDLLGKAITIRGEQGAGATVLDGVGIPGQSGVRIDSGEGPGTVLEGLTLRNFDRGSGAGAAGGAIYVSGSSPTIRDCRFETNHAQAGGALFLNVSSASIQDCVFDNNAAAHQGGAVFTQSGTPIFERSTFENNSANYGGAFLSRTIASTLVTVRDCVFVGNASFVGYAGALAKFDSGSIEIERTRFLSNTSALEGGAVHFSGPGASVRDCTFNSNTAGNNVGGGVSVAAGATAVVRNSTLTNNIGGGLAEPAPITYATMHNCIVWDNSPYQLSANIGITYSTVMGGYGGSIDADPLFVDAWGTDGVRGTLDDDLSLLKSSPCIDAANTTEVLAAYPTDLAGNPRAVDRPKSADTGLPQLGLTVDMGAFEFQVLPPCHRVVNRMVKP